MDALSVGLIDFWKAHGIDHEFGGFHGTVDREGNPKEPTDKGLIQQSRHLWTFSTWYERREQTPEIRAIADQSYRFIARHMRDAKDGQFYYKVSRDGSQVKDPKKLLYAESFAIYALATYGRVFGLEEAKQQALECFRSLDPRSHDLEYLGYDQSKDPGWLAQGAQKGTNTHIHLLEAFTELYRATGDHMVKERLDELVTVTATKLFQPAQNYVHKEFTRDWAPFGDPRCSYGHDIETGWLLMDAVAALGRPEDPVAVDAATRLGRHASDAGFDPEHGGLFEEGPVGAAPDKTLKVWWVQAEALTGLWRLYRLTGERRHIDRLERTLTFIEQHQLDPEYGELYWDTNADGSLGPHGSDKGEEWKASYHGVRALVFTSDFMRDEG
jgi:mannobiose 2-epimerase